MTPEDEEAHQIQPGMPQRAARPVDLLDMSKPGQACEPSGVVSFEPLEPDEPVAQHPKEA